MGNEFIKNAITQTANFCNGTYEKTHEILDYLSFNACPNRPSYKLATDNLQIPEADLTIIRQLLELFSKALGLVIMPFQALNDKKFSVHVYETTNIFMTQNMPNKNDSIITTCDKMLIYICQHKNKINEPLNKQVLKTVSIDNTDYDLPVNCWYSFNIDTEHMVYFYTHVSVSGYKGIVIAVNNNESANLKLIKDEAIDYYDHSLGVKNFSRNKKTDFI